MKRTWAFFTVALFGLASCQDSDRSQTVVSQKYIHKYGFEVDEKEWDIRDREGTIEAFLDNGVKITKNYENGKLHGVTTHSFPYSSTIEKLFVYDQGELLREVVHDRKGIPVRELAHEFDNRKVITHWDVEGAPIRIEEYEDGLLMQGTYFNNNNEIESRVENGSGTRFKRDRNGKLLLIDHMENGKLAKRTTYHPNEQEHIVSYFNDYLLDGEQKIYTSQGNLHMVNQWKNGVLDGVKTSYRGGTILLEVPYTNGSREGIEKRYDEEGTLISEIAYRNNEKHGECTYYNGRNTKKEWYYKGANVAQTRFEILDSRDEVIAQLDE